MNKRNDIDFVIMWVDGNDLEWQKEKNKYSINTNADASIYRYRDWNLLKYWFRGVEKYAPWVRKIHFVTWGHVPEWLDISNSKLNIVNHKDFIPEQYLPTFSANTIELNLHRIKGLSDKFVFFNDDFFLINAVSETDFFDNDLPKDTAILNVHCVKKSLISQYFCINDVGIINEHFDFKKQFRNNFYKWINFKYGTGILRTLTLLACPRFPGFWQHHLAQPYLKSTFTDVWSLENEILDKTCTHKFRETTDVNQWVFKEWQLAKGIFEPQKKSFGKSFFIDRDGLSVEQQIINYITKQQGKMIAINDGEMSQLDFNRLLTNLEHAFDKHLELKSSFEY